MNTLTIKLKQHTPLIHFQHDQEGATLRASEVKPKLDKYILSKLSSEEKSQGKREGWIKEKGDKTWLDYKMRIGATGKRYCHQIKIINADKWAVVSQHIQLEISCDNNLSPRIVGNIREFFIINNFGFRQSKGYGSFTVETIRINGNIQELSQLNYEHILSSSESFNKVIASQIAIPQNIAINLKKYFKLFTEEKDKRDKDKNQELNKQCTVLVPIDEKTFNSQFVFCDCDYKGIIKQVISVKINELRKLNNQSNISKYLKQIINGMNTCLHQNLEIIHNDFLYEYFNTVFNKGITDKYQTYKSGKNKPYSKSHLRDFFGNLQNDTRVVYWDKRFIKQKINAMNLNPKLRDTHREYGKGEISVNDSPNTNYLYIRALLGLEGNFEFLTEDSYTKYVVSVESKEKDAIERFQSIITFKIIDNVIYTCIKTKQALKGIMNKKFSFSLTAKEKSGKNWISSTSIRNIKIGDIITPNLTDMEIDSLYDDIVTFFGGKQFNKIAKS